MGVSENEIGLREGRAKFGDLVNRAEYAGQITYITRHGRRVAAIIPIDLIPQESTMAPRTIIFTRENDNPDWGTDTITITVNDNEVTEDFTVDGISDKDIRSFSDQHEVERYLHDRGIDLTSDGYREQ